ncbi:MAG TPA: restriction endonuclease subunit S, partial [Crocinitomicaceae bacterium]|nr:restriction endonuclease subunit S [Crocinitomicaceae bacterium]
STVDQAIQKTDEIIAKTERLKKGLMQELLSGRVRIREEDGRISFYRETRFKDTEIGKIPEDWEVVRLGEVINYKKGKKPKKLFDIWKDTYLPYLTAEFFRTGRPDKFVDTSKETGIEIVNSDDIVLIWDGSNAGDVFRGLKGVLASTMVKIDVKDPNKVCKNFIYYFLKTKFSILNTQTTGSTIPHVSKTVFENLPIPLPPIPEQRKIAEILSTIDKKLEIERKEKEKLKRIKKGLMDVLLTGRVRVKLDVQSGT